MKLVALGTSGGAPTKNRNCTSFVLQLESYLILFDCAEGTQRRLLQADLKISKIKYIFITHLHLDHIAGLVPLLSTKSMFNIPGDLTIVGPKGLREYISAVLGACGSELNYNYRFYEAEDEKNIKFKEFSVLTRSLNHRVKSYGFRLKFNDKPGNIDLDKVAIHELTVGPDLGKLQKGLVVTNPKGKEVTIADVASEPKTGKVVAFVGDTYLCKGIYGLIQDADVAILESTFQKEDEKRAEERFHLTSYMCGNLADRSNVQNLVLYHFSAAYPGQNGFINDAKEKFPGDVYAPKDLDEIDFKSIYQNLGEK